MLQRLLFVFVISTACVLADDSELNAIQWLKKMSHAKKVLDYYGTVAFFKNGRLDTMKFYHTVDKGLEQERLLSLNSPMREVIRKSGKVSCIFKDSKKVIVNNRPVRESFIVDLPVDFSKSSADYNFSLQGEELVAMLPTRVLSIEAKDKFRYKRKIWIDKEHFLPLKVEVYDLFGMTLEQVVFTDIQVGQVVDFENADEKIEGSDTKHIEQIDSLSFDEADFALTNIPTGFQTVFFARMYRENSTQLIGHLLLSDGFSSISVYRETKADDTKEGLQTLGAINSFTHIIKDDQVTAMGEVPASTVQSIAQGVSFR